MSTDQGFKGPVGGGSIGGKSELGSVFQMLRLWDMSQINGKNNRKLKIGSGDVSQAVALATFDFVNASGVIAVGVPNGANSKRIFEPDNFVLRLHSKRGAGVDGVWAIRNQVDHEPKTSSDQRTHRSTIWVDQGSPQNWAWSQDLMWVKYCTEDGAPITDPEIHFDGDGMLKDFLSNFQGKGSKRRAALMLNISKQGGGITDGGFSASIWHTNVISESRDARLPPRLKVRTDPVTGAKVTFLDPGGTQAQKPASQPATKPSEATAGVGALRGDVKFAMGPHLVSLAVAEPPALPDEDFGTAYHGWMHIDKLKKKDGTELSQPPDRDTAEDPSSNQPIKDPEEDKALWVHILQPRSTAGSPENPMPEPFAGSTTAYPTISGDSGANSIAVPQMDGGFFNMLFEPGKISSVTNSMAIPENYSDMDAVLSMNWKTSGIVSSAGTFDFQFAFRVYANDEDADPADWTNLAFSLGESDMPISTSNVKTFTIRIFSLGVTGGKGGGRVAWFLQRRSDDTAPETFKMVGTMKHSFIPAGQSMGAGELTRGVGINAP